MKHLKEIVTEYQEKYLVEEVFDESISGDIKRIQKLLLDENFLPSAGLKSLFKKLLRRANYPMEVAIVGQFSSGKSTFLNALLSRDILPTGITPVTSKVNYINYAKEYKLKITYHSGANEYHPLDLISNFTDQRHSIEDIKYITLYAPMDILKDISFVDTPGLNSQSLDDTQVTKKILRDVDGIIWLTLLDNAGKESESEILREHLKNFKDKSLCVLNQKDKFNDEQVQRTVSYVRENFADFFSHVIPISAKQALDSRVNQKNVLIDYALESMQKAFKKSSVLHKNARDLSFFKNEFEEFSRTIDDINKHDSSNDEQMMQDSNISEILNFIETVIRPQAKVSKAYSIKKDLNDICDILIKEYETILGVYESLLKILTTKESEILKAFDLVGIKHSKSLHLTYTQMESIAQSITDVIYENIKTKDATRYEEEKGVFGQTKITAHNYEAIYVDIEAILNKLFYENQSLDKQIKATTSYLENIEQHSSEDFRDVFRILKHSIQLWQKPYELIKKNREIASDLEFANTRQFVSKVYENIILEYDRAILGNTESLHKKFAYFNGAISYSYKQITKESIFLVNEKIVAQTKSFEKDPLKYSITAPSNEEILEIVKTNFTFEKIESFLISRGNYLYKIVETAKTQFKQINDQQIEYVISKKQIYLDKIQEMQKIKNQI
ncbi:MAG: small GTP-binding protein [Sulfurimonas sp.]|jgi:small GTP-binding protein